MSIMVNETQTSCRRNKMFTTEEVDTLLDIIYKYAHIVECKSLNSTTSQQKIQAWEAICHEFNKVYMSRRRTVREVRKKYNNLKMASVRRAEGRDPSDGVSKLIDERIRKIKASVRGDTSPADLTNLFNALLEYPDDVDTKSFILHENLGGFTHEDTLNDFSINGSSSTCENIGSVKHNDLSSQNDPLNDPMTPFGEIDSLKANQKKILELIRSKHELAAEKAKKEIEIINIEHTRRLEIMNREHELVVQKLKLEIELLKKN